MFATVLGVTAALWLAKAGPADSYAYYTIYFKQQSLEGLQNNSWVTMKGIRVGTVESVQIAPNNIEQVKVTVKLENGTPVKTDSRAVLGRNLLTGFANIDLTSSSNQAALLKDVLPGEENPIIPEGASKLDLAAQNIPEVIKDVGEALKRVQVLLSDENLESVGRSVQNIETTTAVFAKNAKSLDETLKHAGELVGDLREMSRSITSVARSSSEEIDHLSAKVQSSLDQLAGLLDGLKQEVGRMANVLKSSAQVVVQDINGVAEGIKQAAQAFTKTSDSLGDLRSIVTGPSEKALGPGERVPK